MDSVDGPGGARVRGRDLHRASMHPSYCPGVAGASSVCSIRRSLTVSSLPITLREALYEG